MSPQQVEMATDGFARMTRDTLPREGREPRVSNRAEFEDQLSDFEVEYLHDHSGLMQIKLIPEYDDCEAVLNAFVGSFGQPAYQEQIILRTFVWEDAPNDNRIVLVHSTADICEFQFFSLSAFRERSAAAD